MRLGVSGPQGGFAEHHRAALKKLVLTVLNPKKADLSGDMMGHHSRRGEHGDAVSP
jgi:hypothetical protein